MDVRITGDSNYGTHIKALIVGPAGVGKTRMSSTFKNPIFASAEGGLMSVADRRIPYVNIESSEDLHRLRVALMQDASIREGVFGTKVDSVIIDTIDEIQNILVRERLEVSKNDKLTLPDFGWLREQMRAIVRGFRNLDMNVVFTCHDKESRDDELGKVMIKPALQGAFADEIPNMVDLALILVNRAETQIVDGGTSRVIRRFLQTYPDAQHAWVKDRSGALPQEFEINFEDDYQRMYDTIFNRGGKVK